MAKVAFNDPCYTFRVEFKGSSYEGLKIGKPDEFDYELVNDNWMGKISVLVDATTPGFGYTVQNIATSGQIQGTRHQTHRRQQGQRSSAQSGGGGDASVGHEGQPGS